MIFKDDDDKKLSDGNELLKFADPQEEEEEEVRGAPWKILVVDDEQEVFFVTKMALQDLMLDGRRMEFISAFSEFEAREVLNQHPDIALVLLDVVMEEDDSGLRLVQYIRETLNNQRVRVILRTGQPGEAPEKKVILDYDINDYKEKTELTAQKLSTTVISALRSYRDIMKIDTLVKELEESNRKLAANNRILEEEIKERRTAQETALVHARAAGKAQFATSVLHNIGNVLNSVQVAASLMERSLNKSKIPQLVKTGEMLEPQLENAGKYLSEDPKGKLIPPFLTKASRAIGKEYELLSDEIKDVLERIDLMKDIIETQQSHAKAELKSGTLNLEQIVDEALGVLAEPLENQKVELVKKFDPTTPIIAQKVKLTHVIINLIKNAVEAMSKVEGKRMLTLEKGEGGKGKVFLKIIDTGEGITKENSEKMSTHGFTTKADGHGFGLHFCARAMTEMGGTIRWESDGPGQGAEFTLVFLTPGALPDEPEEESAPTPPPSQEDTGLAG